MSGHFVWRSECSRRGGGTSIKGRPGCVSWESKNGFTITIHTENEGMVCTVHAHVRR